MKTKPNSLILIAVLLFLIIAYLLDLATDSLKIYAGTNI